MHIACCIPKATNTHSECVIIAFTLQQWLHERASLLRYVYSAEHWRTENKDDKKKKIKYRMALILWINFRLLIFLQQRIICIRKACTSRSYARKSYFSNSKEYKVNTVLQCLSASNAADNKRFSSPDDTYVLAHSSNPQCPPCHTVKQCHLPGVRTEMLEIYR